MFINNSKYITQNSNLLLFQKIPIKGLLFYLSIVFSYYLLVTSCAQIGSPTGGAKDTLAPVFMHSSPANGARNYTKKKIAIEFDEYVQVKNASQSVMVSPPLKEKPKFGLRGKSIVIDLNNEPKSNTTYTIDFGNSIQDLNESNPIPSFQFVFSTGESIDSMTISGKLLNAFDLKPVPDAFVMLYENFSDSTPIKVQPDFVSKSQKNGEFFIRNIRSGNYHIFALLDANSNLLFDQPSESIAFLDSVLIPDAQIVEKSDTIHSLKDTIHQIKVIKRLENYYTPDSVNIMMFQEDFKKQFILSSQRNERNKCTFIFNKPTENKFSIENAKKLNPEQFKLERNATGDTITYWLADTLLAKTDTVTFHFRYHALDSLLKPMVKIDTVNVKYSPKKETKDKKKEADNDKKEAKILPVSTNLDRNTALELESNIIITSELPLASFDQSKIQFSTMIDNNTEKPMKFKITQDTLNIRRYTLSTNWVEGTSYKFVVDSAAMSDMYGRANNKINISLRTQREDSYGIIKLELASNYQNCNLIVQLLTETDALVKQVIIENFNESKSLEMKHIKPAKYKMKLIVDKNKSGKWDTGKYLQGLQPESVFYFQEKIIIKANWDTEVLWRF